MITFGYLVFNSILMGKKPQLSLDVFIYPLPPRDAPDEGRENDANHDNDEINNNLVEQLIPEWSLAVVIIRQLI